jgi:hypothetical protein
MNLREKLSAVQHDIWAHWMRYLFSVSVRNPDGSYTIPSDKVERWQRQAQLAYVALSEREKDSDREQADRVLAELQQPTRR